MDRHLKMLLFTLLLFTLTPLLCLAGEAAPKRPAAEAKEPAILLVTFGTSVAKAQAAFANIEKQVQAAFPGSDIRWAYTSKIIRKKLGQSGIQIDSPETALARLMDEGCTKVVVQSLHMIPGAEFHEIYANSRLFGQMTGGMDKVVVSPPLLTSDESMERMLDALLADVVPKERQPGEAVVFMGHGTHHPSDAIYSALMYKLQQRDANLYIGTVEGHPTFDEVKAMLVKKGVKKAYLIPLMTVAGDHALNDMAGDEPDSWQSQLAKAGIKSVPVLKGLAEFNSLVGLWIENLKVAMEQAK